VLTEATKQTNHSKKKEIRKYTYILYIHMYEQHVKRKKSRIAEGKLRRKRIIEKTAREIRISLAEK